MRFPSKLHPWKFAALAVILLISPLVSLVAAENASQSAMSPSLVLFGAGARWAARNGNSALYVNWKDNWNAHHSTDGGNWVWFGESAMDNWRSSITNALQQSGFQVAHAGDIPDSLDSYDLVVLSAYYAVEPRHEPLIRDYILNGGSVIMWAGTPCYLTAYYKTLSTNTDLSSIEGWFGSSNYINAGGSVAPAFDNPLGTSLKKSDVLFNSARPTYAGVTSLVADTEAIAFWSSGAVFAFTKEYGAGRVYYQAFTDAETPEDFTPSPVPSGIPTLISISTDAPSSFVGFIVTVCGNLNDTLGIALFNEPVFLYYTFPEYGSWIPVTSDVTDESGGYKINWIPPATGSFTLKAEWNGNATHSGSSDIVSLSIMPYKNEQVFSVESNSTVTGLDFNSTSLKFNFSVSGPDDTKGYVKLLVAKSIVTDVASIEVLLDGKKTNYSASSLGDSWLLIFIYTHSTHDVTISLGVQSEPKQDAFLTTLVAVAAGASATIVGLGVLLYFKKRKNDLGGKHA
jgi:hypothetical protein